MGCATIHERNNCYEVADKTEIKVTNFERGLHIIRQYYCVNGEFPDFHNYTVVEKILVFN